MCPNNTFRMPFLFQVRFQTCFKFLNHSHILVRVCISWIKEKIRLIHLQHINQPIYRAFSTSWNPSTISLTVRSARLLCVVNIGFYFGPFHRPNGHPDWLFLFLFPLSSSTSKLYRHRRTENWLRFLSHREAKKIG